MTFEEWRNANEFGDCSPKAAWEAAFEEGYKFANKENEEYDKTLTGDRAV